MTQYGKLKRTKMKKRIYMPALFLLTAAIACSSAKTYEPVKPAEPVKITLYIYVKRAEQNRVLGAIVDSYITTELFDSNGQLITYLFGLNSKLLRRVDVDTLINGWNGRYKDLALATTEDKESLGLGENVFKPVDEYDFAIAQNTGGGITVTGYLATQQDLAIPAKISGRPVTSIGDSAFRSYALSSWFSELSESLKSHSQQLTNVVIPNSVTSIGKSAFRGNQLTNVVIPNSVTSIGDGAFAENQLINVVIPNGVTSIGSAFWENQLTNVVIPNSVKNIGANAFKDNQLTSVVIPNSVTSIGSGAFANNKLTSVVIPDKVALDWNWRSEETNVFANNPITSITLGRNIDCSGWGFEEDFVNFYESKNKAAGTYTKEGRIWVKTK
jgi:hypothetical protein